MTGTVVAIHVADEVGGPVHEVASARVLAGLGIEGDRLVRVAQEKAEPVAPHRQVTLIAEEALATLERDHGIALTAAASRRNVCTTGIDLNALVGRTFRVGSVTLRGAELCEPCGYLQKLTGQDGLVAGLKGSGGLRAEALGVGTMAPGDAIEAI